MKSKKERGIVSMKKTIITVVIVIIAIILIGVGVLLINLNKEKESITASEFYEYATKKGYSVYDVNKQFSEYDYIKQVYVAAGKDLKYQIEFYEIQDDEYATKFYNYNKSIFESSKGNSSAETNVGMKNYSKYTLSTNGKYMVVSRINNTVIYVEVDDNYKDTIKSILKELGY